MKCNNGLKWCKSNVTTSLIHIMPLVSCYTPLKTSENVFGCFPGVQNKTSGMNWVNKLTTKTATVESLLESSSTLSNTKIFKVNFWTWNYLLIILNTSLHWPGQVINPFHATGLFLYPLKYHKTSSFMMFSGGKKRDQWHNLDY